MFCPKCGTKNDDTAFICIHCGQPLRAEGPAAGNGFGIPLSKGPAATGVNPPPQPQFSQPACQPAPAAVVPVNIPSHLAPAIITTLCCCLPTGIAAIVFASQVNGKLQSGDVAGAQKSSHLASVWIWVSVGLGIVYMIFQLIWGAISLATHPGLKDFFLTGSGESLTGAWQQSEQPAGQEAQPSAPDSDSGDNSGIAPDANQ